LNQKHQKPISIIDALYSNEDGDAQLFTNSFCNRFCYDKSERIWYEFKGHWCEDRIEEVLFAVSEVVQLYQAQLKYEEYLIEDAHRQGKTEAADQHEVTRKNLLRRIRLLQGAHRKKNVLKLAAAGHNSLAITGEEWDQNPWVLCCKNGVIDLQNGNIRTANQKDYIKKFAPTEWQGISFSAPTWEKSLEQIFDGNKDLIAYVHRLFGYAITGLSTEHILPIFYGQGRNGKGTLLEILRYVLGPLAGPIQAEMLLDQTRLRSSSSPSPDIMALRGRRIGWASESDKGRRLKADKVKWLVGGDTLVGRQPFAKHQIEFRPTHTLFLITNSKPKADPDDYALFQRIHLIPFTLSFIDNPTEPNERQRDPYLLERLKTEAPGILAWLVRGCLEWQRQGLNPPPIVKEATEQYRSEEDDIGRFLTECCFESSEAKVQSSKLYTGYKSWCEQEGDEHSWGNILPGIGPKY
jgi:putative DNA primase/helicase